MNANEDNRRASEVSEADFRTEVLQSAQPVLVAFWAPWSHPCQILISVLDDVASACASNLKVVKVNADDNPDLSLWYEVQSIPTLLYIVSGKLRAKVVGTASKEAIISKLQSVLSGGEAASSAVGPEAGK